MTCYSKDSLPTTEWGEYVRIAPTRAARMDGPFKLWTPEGMVYCEDGWIALDPQGHPFAIDAEEFERKWHPAGDVFINDAIPCDDHSGDCTVCLPIHPKQSQSTSHALARQ